MVEFDQTDIKNLGRPLYFSIEDHIKAIEGLIKSDEIEMAFKLCEMVPAWYRENYPPVLDGLKKALYKNLYTPMVYASDPDEAAYTKEQVIEQVDGGYVFPRGDLAQELVKQLNDSGHVPWVFELSTSHGPIPLKLAKDGMRFDFFSKNLNQAALAKVIEWLGVDVWKPKGPSENQKSIFICFEALEHMFNQADLRTEYYKMGIDFDYILLSVPYGTLGGGLPNWETRPIGHLRTYTKKEFYDLANDYFPGFSWTLTVSNSLVLLGRRNGSI